MVEDGSRHPSAILPGMACRQTSWLVAAHDGRLVTGLKCSRVLDAEQAEFTTVYGNRRPLGNRAMAGMVCLVAAEVAGGRGGPPAPGGRSGSASAGGKGGTGRGDQPG